MKIIKIFTIIIFILLLIDSFAYFNILTSEKYEVDLLETHYKVKGKEMPNEQIEAKKIEIERQKKRTKIELTVLSVLFVTFIFLWIYKGSKMKA